jgi:hypothetical protein
MSLVRGIKRRSRDAEKGAQVTHRVGCFQRVDRDSGVSSIDERDVVK